MMTSQTPIKESARQTATRLRRSLHQRWPETTFRVRLAKGNPTLQVQWHEGPSTDKLAAASYGFARVLTGVPQPSVTIWVSETCTLAAVMPRIREINLTRTTNTGDETRTA